MPALPPGPDCAKCGPGLHAWTYNWMRDSVPAQVMIGQSTYPGAVECNSRG